MSREQKTGVINELRLELEQFLQVSLDKNTRTKIESYLVELKKVIKNRDGLINLVEQLDKINIINLPESLKTDISELAELVVDDYEFWRDFVFELSGYIFEVEDKLKSRDIGCLAFVMKMLKRS